MGPWKRLCALPALWTGLLYDRTALDSAWDIVKKWSLDDHNYLRQEVPKTAAKLLSREELFKAWLSRPWRLPLLVSGTGEN